MHEEDKSIIDAADALRTHSKRTNRDIFSVNSERRQIGKTYRAAKVNKAIRLIISEKQLQSACSSSYLSGKRVDGDWVVLCLPFQKTTIGFNGRGH